MAEDFDTIELVSRDLRNKLDAEDRKNLCLLYAFNSVGKTRIAKEFTLLNTEDEDTGEWEYKTLCYSAFLEDLFKWDNENNILNFDTNSWEFRLVKDEGLGPKIADNFKNFLNTKTEPEIDLDTGKAVFNIITGGDVLENIKISRGEEGIFMWSVFYTILEVVRNELTTLPERRSVHIFDNLQYIVIDDPVSSIDDQRIISLALRISELIKGSSKEIFLETKRKELEGQNFTPEYITQGLKEHGANYLELNLKYLITTHHPLFYNVVFNSIKAKKRYAHVLKKDDKFYLIDQSESPFGYHLLIKDEIQKAIEKGVVKKYHFNLFRSLLEKTANFLGYVAWSDCFHGDRKSEMIRILNLYSHDRLAELENREMNDSDKKLFTEAFNAFVEDFRYQ